MYSPVSNPTLIGEEITKEFKSRVTSNPNTFFDVNEDFNLLEPMISLEDNNFLC